MASELTLVPDDLNLDATIRGLNAGQQVFGRYTLRHVLGRGGMGVVWLGMDNRLERDVALKFLPEEVYFDPSALEELKQETRRCLDLTHPNIIRIHDFVKDRQAAAISMEYLDGKTLAALRLEKEHRVFEVDEIKNWIAKVCDALRYAHEDAGVVHRDLKPANLMVNSRGQVKIADFGISQSMCDSMSRRTLRRGTSGTLAYMSPQQMCGERSRMTDDIYALGATIYEFLTSKPPFYTGDMSFQVRLIVPPSMTERRRDLEIAGGEIPREWEETIAACLAKQPEERPRTMAELAERLRLSIAEMPKVDLTVAAVAPVVEVQTVTRKKVTPPPLPRKRISKKRLFQLGAAASALGLSGWLLGIWVLWPFFATPGELRLTSNPPGASVHIPGLPDRITPAAFSRLRIGRYRLMVSAEGFDPLEQTVNVTPGSKIDLGTIQLQRAFGKLSLLTLPRHAHYLLVGSSETGGFQKEGFTPDFLPQLPSGTYQLSLSAPGYPEDIESLQIPAHGTMLEKSDLIQMAVAQGAISDAGKVFRGQMAAGQLNDNERVELLGLYKKAFSAYLSAGLLAPASEQLANMKASGLETEPEEQLLAAKRSLIQEQVTAQIKSLMSEGRYATVREKLKNLDGVLEKESLDSLNADFQQPLAQYQKQIGDALAPMKSASPEIGYAQLQTLSAHYPDDSDVELALAAVQTRMPPNYDRLTAQLRNFREFLSANKDFTTEPALLAMQALFSEELKQLDMLTNAVAAAKEGPSGARKRLLNLESEKEDLQKRRVGSASSDPFTQTFNFLRKAVTGHSTTTPDYFPSQEAKKQAIAAVQDQIEAEQQNLALPPLHR